MRARSSLAHLYEKSSGKLMIFHAVEKLRAIFEILDPKLGLSFVFFFIL